MARPLRRKRSPRPPRLPFPVQAERKYKAWLLGFVRELHEQTVAVLWPILERVQAEVAASRPRGDSAAGEIDDGFTKVRNRRGADEAKAEIGRFLDGIGNDVSEVNRRGLTGQVKQVLGLDPMLREPWLGETLSLFRSQNVSLIKSIEDRYFSEVEGIVGRGLQTGQRVQDLAKDIEERYRVGRSRARLIARDQVGKLQGQLSKLRQEELGVGHYIWRTSQDERVRPKHAENEGKRFPWKEPPPDTGHPGQDILCRCYPEPDIEDMLSELEAGRQPELRDRPIDALSADEFRKAYDSDLDVKRRPRGADQLGTRLGELDRASEKLKAAKRSGAVPRGMTAEDVRGARDRVEQRRDFLRDWQGRLKAYEDTKASAKRSELVDDHAATKEWSREADKAIPRWLREAAGRIRWGTRNPVLDPILDADHRRLAYANAGTSPSGRWDTTLIVLAETYFFGPGPTLERLKGAVHEVVHAVAQKAGATCTSLGDTGWLNTRWRHILERRLGPDVANQHVGPQGSTGPHEDMAETLSLYFVNRRELERTCPERARLLDEVLSSEESFLDLLYDERAFEEEVT